MQLSITTVPTSVSLFARRPDFDFLLLRSYALLLPVSLFARFPDSPTAQLGTTTAPTIRFPDFLFLEFP